MILRKQRLPGMTESMHWISQRLGRMHRYVTGFLFCFVLGFVFWFLFFVFVFVCLLIFCNILFFLDLCYGTGEAPIHNTEHVHCWSNSTICRVLLSGISSTFKTHCLQKCVGCDSSGECGDTTTKHVITVRPHLTHQKVATFKTASSCTWPPPALPPICHRKRETIKVCLVI